MQRSIIQLAENTLVVSLPSKWVKSVNLKKGDLINITPIENKLVISPEMKNDETKTKITISNNPVISKRIINTIYKKGFDEVELILESPAIIKDIKAELSGLLGFEIISQSKNYCLIKNIASPLEKEFDNILRKVFLIILEMGECCLNSSFEEVLSMEETVDKLTNFCKRCLNKRQVIDPKKTTLLYCIFWELEKIADEYYELAKFLASKRNKNADDLIKNINDFFRTFYDLFYKRNDELDKNFEDKYNKLIKKCNFNHDPELMHYLNNIINRIYEVAGPFYAMIL